MAVALPPLDLPTKKGPCCAPRRGRSASAQSLPGSPSAKAICNHFDRDRAAATPAREAIERRLQQSLAATLLVLAAWAGWWLWRNHLDARRLPFMRAWNTIKRLRAAPGDERSDTWILLHRAMNAAAGCAMHAGSVEFLVARLPHLRPLKPRIAEFYQASNRRFFEQSNQDTPFALREFCDGASPGGVGAREIAAMTLDFTDPRLLLLLPLAALPLARRGSDVLIYPCIAWLPEDAVGRDGRHGAAHSRRIYDRRNRPLGWQAPGNPKPVCRESDEGRRLPSSWTAARAWMPSYGHRVLKPPVSCHRGPPKTRPSESRSLASSTNAPTIATRSLCSVRYR